MSRYELYADSDYVGQRTSLVEACGVARDDARARPGVLMSVKHDGDTVATYRVLKGAMTAWVR